MNLNQQIATIVLTVSERFGVSVEDMRGPWRNRVVVEARHVAMYLAQTLTNKSLVAIGYIMQNRHHTTVMYGVDKIRAKIKSDPEFAQQVEETSQECKVRLRAATGTRNQKPVPDFEKRIFAAEILENIAEECELYNQMLTVERLRLRAEMLRRGIAR